MRFEHISVENGLADNLVHDIFMDSKGYMWFCTQDGISRFNGVSFTNFRQVLGDSNSLNGQISMDVKEDRDGILWFAMLGGGLNRFDPVTEKFEHYLLPKGMNAFTSGKSASKVLIDSDNQVWVGTYDMGFNLLDKKTGRFEHFELSDRKLNNMAEAFQKNSVTDMLEDASDNNILWIAGNNGLYRFNKTTKQVDRTPLWVQGQLDTVSSFRCLLMEKPGELWAGVWTRGLTRYHTQTGQWEFFPHNPAEWQKGNVSANIVFDVERKRAPGQRDKLPEFWLSSKDEGLLSFDLATRKFTRYKDNLLNERLSLSGNAERVFEDKAGRVWVSIYQKGVHKLNPANQPSNHTAISPAAGCPANSPLESLDAALDISRDLLYVTTAGCGSLQVFEKKPNGKPVFRYSKLITTDQNARLNVCVDVKRRVWLAGMSPQADAPFSLYLFDPDTRQVTPFGQKVAPQVDIHQSFINDILEDRDHNIWFATSFGGLIKLEAGGGQMVQYLQSPTNPGYPAAFVRVVEIEEDSKGNLWMCAVENGLFKFDPRTETMTHYTVFSRNGHSVGDERIITVAEDATGLLWVGTEWNGLWLLDPSKPGDQNMKHYGTENGLTGSKVGKIEMDKAGTIWVRTSQGICSYDPATDQFYIFGGKEGSSYSSMGAEGMTALENGELFVGGEAGMFIFNPVKDVRKGSPPLLVFTDFLVNNKPVRFEKSLNYLDEVTLDYQDNFFSVSFSALDFSDPELVQFAYMLKGYEEEWNYPAKGFNKAVYTKVGEGTYTLKVKAANSNGVWNETGISLSIRVLPPFYRTWWAYLGYLLAAGTVLYLLRAYQIRRLQEKADMTHLREIDTLKTKLYTNITHEFRTPLTVIMGMAEQLEADSEQWSAGSRQQAAGKEGFSATLKDRTKLILRNAGSLLRLINQMLDLSKLDSGKMQLHFERGDAVLFLQYLFESFHTYAATKDIRMTFYPETKSLVMNYDRQKLQEIVSNLLSNAIKFTPEGGKIIFHVSEISTGEAPVGRMIQLKISDTGIGIASENIHSIFERFYQVADTPTHKSQGSGIGLALTKELVELMGGSISVKSEVGKGSEFTIRLPDGAATDRSTSDSQLEPVLIPATATAATNGTGGSPENGDLPLLLLIEDNADVAEYIRACLQGRYVIEWAGNGAIGIEKALELIPDIIISDVMMPEKDGYEVTQFLKNDERTCHIPIVLLTAKADIQSKLEGLGVGADAYLSKPFLKEELFIRLEKLVELRRRLQEKYAGRDFIALAAEAPSPAIPSPDDVFLKKATRLILDHLDDARFGNEELARAMTLSESQLNRKLKALTDKTLSLFIRSVRLQQGKILLQTTDMNISEIAYAVGFNDPFYFSRTFSQEFGDAPSKFRN